MRQLQTSIVERTDGYKPSHWLQVPPGTTRIHSYEESRGGQFPYTIFTGLQPIMEQYLAGEQVTRAAIENGEEFVNTIYGTPGIFNRAGWEHILKNHGGRLPLRIRAVPEGMKVPVSNVLFTVENTDPAVPWLTNYVESVLLKTWYSTTVTTLSFAIKTVLLDFLERTGSPENVNYMFQDFGYRGAPTEESAEVGGAANLFVFRGSDTLVGIPHLIKFYGAHLPDFAKCTIPASEHSTVTSWGRTREGDAHENMIDRFQTTPVACVSDSYDIFAACSDIFGERLKEKILRRTFPVIVRPDSGDPKTVILRCLEILGEKFGYEINSKGYKVLCPKIRLIQGDGVNYWSIIDILTHITAAGWSADNIAFGMGGALLQMVNRDTQKFAIKCSEVDVNGESIDVVKDPVTDHGKRSKGGSLALVTNLQGELQTIRRKDLIFPYVDHTNEVFLNGDVTLWNSYSSITSRIDAEFAKAA